MPKKITLSKKNIVSEQVDTFGGYEVEGTLKEVEERIQGWITRFGPDARIDYSRDGFEEYSDSPGFQILVNRKETDEEYQDRIHEERSHIAAIRERDRKEFERLSVMFKEKK